MTIHDIPSGTSTAEVRRRHHKALDMARRGLAMVQNRTNDLAPAVLEQPSTYYVDPERYAREVEVLFHRRPVFAALSVELPGPGAFKALDLPGFPLVVTRQQDGSLRAMLNSCRHRGSTIATGAGSARAFVCKYHGWTYDLDGSLRRIRAERNFGEIDPSCTGLVQVAVAEKYGMVFVRATPLERDPSP